MKKTCIAGLVLLLIFSTASIAQSLGIQVHGYWKIEIFNADGSLASSVEFQNALVNPSFLSGTLKGDFSTGGTYVTIGVTSGNGPCSNSDCAIAPSGVVLGQTPASTNLVTILTGASFETIRMTGSVTASTASAIDSVATWVSTCGNKTPSDCRLGADSESVLTRKTLASVVNVIAGQIIQITVDITFS